MDITAKVKLNRKGPVSAEQVELEFNANYADDNGNRVNEEWSRYTPNLYLRMFVTEDAARHFEQGKAYTLTFTPES
jgi:hypothetical protein